jgi:hypothetical protein
MTDLGTDRSAGEVDELPMELKTPLAVANHLLDTSALMVPETTARDVKDNEQDTVTSDSSPTASDNVRFRPSIITGQY